MKAAVLYEAGRPLEVEDLAMPAVGEDDVLIKVAACGVCHTDLKVVGGWSRIGASTCKVSSARDTLTGRSTKLWKT